MTLESSHESNRHESYGESLSGDLPECDCRPSIEPDSLNVLKIGFGWRRQRALHGHAINCGPCVHRFRMGRTPKQDFTPAEWREFPRMRLCAQLPCMPCNGACAFLQRLRVVCCLFCRFPARGPEGLSGGVLITMLW